MPDPILTGNRDAVPYVLRIGLKATERECRAWGIQVDERGRELKMSGQPIYKDRFLIASAREDDGVRPLAREFAKFNRASLAKAITVVRGNLIYADRASCWPYQRRAQILGGDYPSHPHRRPACQAFEGEGTAERLYRIGGKGVDPPDGAARLEAVRVRQREYPVPEGEEWYRVSCEGRKCRFAMVGKCKVQGALYFRPRWRDEAEVAPPMKIATAGWNTAELWQSFFADVEKQAADLRLPREAWDYTSCPIMLTLAMQTRPKVGNQPGRRFPVVTLSTDGDLTAWLLAQKAEREMLGATAPVALPEAEAEPEVVDADYSDVTVGVPGEQGEMF